VIVTNLNQEQLRRLARLGAVARLEQLREEEAAIRAEFPELFGGKRGKSGKSKAAAKGPGTRRRRRAAMTAAQRKEVSERMRKYWAERRKASAK
jgi:hypothetical protein